MRQQNVFERQGKKLALYAGVLDQAHNGDRYELAGVTTEVLQEGTPENGQRWTVLATVRMRCKVPRVPTGDDPREWDYLRDGDGQIVYDVYTGIGTASPEDITNPNEKKRPLPIAETRAKKRAMSDATNIAEEVAEEFGGAEEGGNASRGGSNYNPAERNRAQAASDVPPAARKPAKDTSGEPITEQQKTAIASIVTRLSLEAVDTAGWTQGQAGEWIKQNANARPAKAAA